MGKATNYRVISVARTKLVVVILPCIGGLLFLGGSFCFWPNSSHDTANAGALCFLTGSFCSVSYTHLTLPTICSV